jgi:hypothetical protein
MKRLLAGLLALLVCAPALANTCTVRQAGATDQTVYVEFIDETTGIPNASRAYNDSGIDLEYVRAGAAAVDITEATQTASGAHSDGGFVTVGHGRYRLDLPDAAVAAGVPEVVVQGVITGYIMLPCVVALSPPTNVVSFGGTAGTFSSGRPEVNTTHAAGTAWGSGAITAASIADGAIDNATFGCSAVSFAVLGIVDCGTAQSATSTTLVLRSALSIGDDAPIGMTLVACGSTQGYCQSRIITDWVSSTDTATVEAWTVTLSGTITYYLFGTAPSSGGGLDAAGVRAAIGMASANLDTQLADLPTNAELTSAVANVSVDEIQATALADLFNTDSGTTYASAVAGSVVKETADNAGGSALTEAGIADAVWDELIAGHVDSGSTGEALNAAGGAGDPWITALPGAYTAGQAGYILGTNLNATVSSRASQTSVDTVDDLLDTEMPALTTAVADLPTNAELATSQAAADDATLAAVAALNNLSSAQAQTAAAAALTAYDPATRTEATADKDEVLAAVDGADVNVETINGATVLGDGTSLDKWRGNE